MALWYFWIYSFLGYLLEKMFAEASGIIYKAVMQLKEVIKNGYKLTEPRAIVEARNEYFRTNNIVSAFADECLEDFVSTGKNACDTITTIYSAFTRWCRCNKWTFRSRYCYGCWHGVC